MSSGWDAVLENQLVIYSLTGDKILDANDPEFIRDPTGLYAIYYGEEPIILLQATETPNHWDPVMRIRRVHLDKLIYLLTECRGHYQPPEEKCQTQKPNQ